jgi:hypothetical protein
VGYFVDPDITIPTVLKAIQLASEKNLKTSTVAILSALLCGIKGEDSWNVVLVSNQQSQPHNVSRQLSSSHIESILLVLSQSDVCGSEAQAVRYQVNRSIENLLRKWPRLIMTSSKQTLSSHANSFNANNTSQNAHTQNLNNIEQTVDVDMSSPSSSVREASKVPMLNAYNESIFYTLVQIDAAHEGPEEEQDILRTVALLGQQEEAISAYKERISATNSDSITRQKFVISSIDSIGNTNDEESNNVTLLKQVQPTSAQKQLKTYQTILDDVYYRHLMPCLQRLLGKALESPAKIDWDKHTFARLVFFMLLNRSINTVTEHFDVILPVLAVIADPKNEAAFRIDALTFVYKIFSKSSSKQSPQASSTSQSSTSTSTSSSSASSPSSSPVFISADNIILLIRAILVPNLTWRVGRVAESIRMHAITSLVALFCTGGQGVLAQPNRTELSSNTENQCSTSESNSTHSHSSGESGSYGQNNIGFHQGFRYITPEVLEKCQSVLLPVLCSACAEDEVVIRLYSAQVLRALFAITCTAIDDEMMVKLAQEFVKRLDDSDDDVRVEFVHVFRVFFARLVPPRSRGTWDSCDVQFTYIIKNLVVHLDDPNTRIKAVVLQLLKEISSYHPSIFIFQVDLVKEKHVSKNLCLALLDLANQHLKKEQDASKPDSIN